MPSNSGPNVGGHARLPSTSQAFHSPTPSGETETTAVRRKHAEPVTPVTAEHGPDGSQECQACVQDSEATSEIAEVASNTLPPEPAPEPRSSPTIQELQFDVRCIMNGTDPDMAECFQNASSLPPITTDSLAELDMPRIINNPKLRHDVNFDRELHFRPNLDGSKGKEKMKQADEYWKALEGELFMYAFVFERRSDPQQAQNDAYWQAIRNESQNRLPKLFETIRDILKTLVPDYDQKAVMDRLDKDLLMQEIQNGVCDLVDLANWLAKILKKHCAPMRDSEVDRMQETIKQGTVDNKSATLVKGIKQLLTILEAMKLDVANHQIRHMRPLLVDDTVNFQLRYNAHRIAIKKIDVPRSRTWFDNEMCCLTEEEDHAPGPLEALTSALIRGLLTNDHRNLYPPTFYLDADRLKALHTDLHSRVYHAVCADILLELTPKHAPKSELVRAVTSLHMTVGAIVGASGKFLERLENIAVEIMRIVMTMEGRQPPFDALLLNFVEDRLRNDLRPSSVSFEKHAHDFCEKLLPKVQVSVQRHAKLSALQLQDRFVQVLPLLPPPIGFGAVCGPVSPPQPFDPDDDTIRRLTHLIVLHWQVWADLVYLAPPEEDADSPSSSNDQSRSSSVSSSPMMPVARAVYAPGRKWLPIGVEVTEVPSGIPSPLPSPNPQAQSPSDNAQQKEPSSSEQPQADTEHQQPA